MFGLGLAPDEEAAAGLPTGSSAGGWAHMTRAPGSPCSKAWVRARGRGEAQG